MNSTIRTTRVAESIVLNKATHRELVEVVGVDPHVVSSFVRVKDIVFLFSCRGVLMLGKIGHCISVSEVSSIEIDLIRVRPFKRGESFTVEVGGR